MPRQRFRKALGDAAVETSRSTPEVEPAGRWFGLCGSTIFLVKAYRRDGDSLEFLRGYLDLEELTRERSPGSWWSSALIAEGLALQDESEPLELLEPLFLDAIREGHVVSVLGGPQLYRKVAALCDAAQRRWDSALRGGLPSSRHAPSQARSHRVLTDQLFGGLSFQVHCEACCSMELR